MFSRFRQFFGIKVDSIDIDKEKTKMTNIINRYLEDLNQPVSSNICKDCNKCFCKTEDLQTIDIIPLETPLVVEVPEVTLEVPQVPEVTLEVPDVPQVTLEVPDVPDVPEVPDVPDVPDISKINMNYSYSSAIDDVLCDSEVFDFDSKVIDDISDLDLDNSE